MQVLTYDQLRTMCVLVSHTLLLQRRVDRRETHTKRFYIQINCGSTHSPNTPSISPARSDERLSSLPVGQNHMASPRSAGYDIIFAGGMRLTIPLYIVGHPAHIASFNSWHQWWCCCRSTRRCQPNTEYFACRLGPSHLRRQ